MQSQLHRCEFEDFLMLIVYRGFDEYKIWMPIFQSYTSCSSNCEQCAAAQKPEITEVGVSVALDDFLFKPVE